MADTLSREARSERMSRVSRRGNKSTELRLLAILRRNSLKGWRRGYPLYGKPDFAFVRERVAVFVDGCFWHGCSVHYRRPKSRQDFWDVKVRANMRRDSVVSTELQKRGWRVIRIWEHDLTAGAEAVLVAILAEAIGHPPTKAA